MRSYKTTITPTSNFSTSLKGDTLFGQLCWAIRYTFTEDRLKELLGNYEKTPFLVVSDAYASGYLPKPTMPSRLLGEDSQMKKINRKKVWLTLDDLQNGKFHNAKTDKDVGNNDKTESIMRNSINYKTSSTSGDGFDPYGESETSLNKKDIYFLIDDRFSLKELKESFELVSSMGYGKDATVGKGRFEIGDFEELDIKKSSSTFMALSPFTPQDLGCKDIFYEPFTRFGKSGAIRANTNAFKKPIILANSGAVINFGEKKDIKYVGKGIKNISTYKDIVHQGYSIVFPIKEL